MEPIYHGMNSIRPPPRGSILPEAFLDYQTVHKMPKYKPIDIMNVLAPSSTPQESLSSSLSDKTTKVCPSTPSESLPRLQVYLRNELSRILPSVKDPDEMPLESMLHQHAFILHARNEEILMQINNSDPKRLKWWEHVSFSANLRSFSEARLWRLSKGRVLSRRRSSDHSDWAPQEINPVDSSHHADDDWDDVNIRAPWKPIKTIEDRSSEALTVLTDLRELALGHWLLALYKVIIESSYSAFDKIEALFHPLPSRPCQHSLLDLKKLNAESRPFKQVDLNIRAHMHALAIILKLNLLFAYERPDPETYWRTDFEHLRGPAKVSASFLYHQSKLAIQLFWCYEEASNTYRSWWMVAELKRERRMEIIRLFYEAMERRENKSRKSEKGKEEEGEEKESVATVADRRDGERNKLRELRKEEKQNQFFQFTQRLSTLQAANSIDKVHMWLESIGQPGNEDVYGLVLTDVERTALCGTTWWIDSELTTLSYMEAMKIIKLHGGKLHKDPTTPPTHIITYSPSPYDILRSNTNSSQIKISEYMLLRYIHACAIDLTAASAHKEGLRGLTFEFVGVLPRMDWEQAVALVRGHGGTVLTSGRADYQVIGIAVDESSTEMGVKRVSEEEFLEILRTSLPPRADLGKRREFDQGDADDGGRAKRSRLE